MLQYPTRTGTTERAALVRGRGRGPAAGAAGGVGGRPGPADRRDPPVGHARPARRARAGRAGRPARPVRDAATPRRGAGDVGGVHPPGPVAALPGRGRARRSRRPAGDPAGSAPRPAPRGHRGRHRPARPRRADPVLRRLPGPGPGPLGRCPGGAGVLPGVLRPVPPGRAARPTGGCAGWRRSWPGSGTPTPTRSSRSASRSRLLGVPEEEWDDYLSATLLALRGWAGILRFLEEPRRPGRPPGPAGEPGRVPGRPAAAGPAGARPRGPRGARVPPGRSATLRAELRGPVRAAGPARASSSGRSWSSSWPGARLDAGGPAPAGPADWATLVGEIEAFTGLERRRLFHLAYERRFCTQTLDALALHARQPAARGRPAPPRFQAVFCLDEREESFRRHLEEVAPDVRDVRHRRVLRVAMYYRGAADAHFMPLCPAVDPARSTGWPRRWSTARARPTGGGPESAGRSGTAVAPGPRRQPDASRRGGADGRGRRAGLGPAGRRGSCSRG